MDILDVLCEAVAPRLVRLPEAALVGDRERSAAAQAKATALRAVYDAAEGVSRFNGVIGGLKCALNLLGIEAGPTASPMIPLGSSAREAVARVLRSQGLS